MISANEQYCERYGLSHTVNGLFTGMGYWLKHSSKTDSYSNAEMNGRQTAEENNINLMNKVKTIIKNHKVIGMAEYTL